MNWKTFKLTIIGLFLVSGLGYSFQYQAALKSSIQAFYTKGFSKASQEAGENLSDKLFKQGDHVLRLGYTSRPNTYKPYIATLAKTASADEFVEKLVALKIKNEAAERLVKNLGLEKLRKLDGLTSGMDDIQILRLYHDALDPKFYNFITNSSIHLNSYKKLYDAGISQKIGRNINVISQLSEGKRIIDVPTINSKFKGQIIDGVAMVEKIVITKNGLKLRAVFPDYSMVSLYQVKIPANLYKATDADQFAYALSQLQRSMNRDPNFDLSRFPESLQREILNKEIRAGAVSKGPSMLTGFSWHHSEELGIMQLIPSAAHKNVRHTGGRSFWGGGAEFRHKKKEPDMLLN